jgi:hypothetical protein
MVTAGTTCTNMKELHILAAQRVLVSRDCDVFYAIFPVKLSTSLSFLLRVIVPQAHSEAN